MAPSVATAPATPAGSGFFGWIRRLFGAEPVAAPPPTVAPVTTGAEPATPPRDARGDARRGEQRRGDRGERGGPGPKCGARRGRGDEPREDRREERSDAQRQGDARREGRRDNRRAAADAAADAAAKPAEASRSPRPERVAPVEADADRDVVAAFADSQPGGEGDAGSVARENRRRRGRRGGRARDAARGETPAAGDSVDAEVVADEAVETLPVDIERPDQVAALATAAGEAMTAVDAIDAGEEVDDAEEHAAQGDGERKSRRRRRGRRDRREGEALADATPAEPAGEPAVDVAVEAAVDAADAPHEAAVAAVAPQEVVVEVVAVAAPSAPPVAAVPPRYVLPADDLIAVAQAAGLEWVNSDLDKVRAAQAAIASEPPAVRVPRERRPQIVIDEGPLVLVETRKDLSQMKLPFELAGGGTGAAPATH